MRIGLFTDTYRPSINGIVFVVESTKKHLEALGHEVYVFCPARSIRPSKHALEFDEDEHIIRFPTDSVEFTPAEASRNSMSKRRQRRSVFRPRR